MISSEKDTKDIVLDESKYACYEDGGVFIGI